MLFELTKQFVKGPLQVNGLNSMVERFEKRGSLKVQSGKGRTPVPQDIKRKRYNGNCQVSNGQYYWTFSTRDVTQNFDMSYCTIWKILQNFIHFCPYKIMRMQQLRHTNHYR